jgi:hypothetical protein
MPSRLAILIGGAILAPPFCFAHGIEFILAKLDLTTPGLVQITLTADYSSSPMIQGEDEARRIFPDCLQVRQFPDGKAVPLTTLGTLTFEKRDAFDPDAPIPPDPLAEGQKHDILAATLHWKTDATTLRFEVPRTSKHDVLIWRKNPDPEKNAQWQLLLGGDQSSDISLPPRPRQNLWPYLALSSMLVLLVAIAHRSRTS